MISLEMIAMGDTLYSLQRVKNQGRGVCCVRAVATGLRCQDWDMSCAIVRNEWDKIRSYPDIASYLVENGLYSER